MAKTYVCEVVVPERPCLLSPWCSRALRDSEGELGVLANHIPLITALKPGEVLATFADERTTSRIVISGGFMDVAQERTDDTAELAQKWTRSMSPCGGGSGRCAQDAVRSCPGSPEANEAQRAAAHAEAQIRAARSA